jgi:N-acetylmuramic acid 6-phosphate etherase
VTDPLATAPTERRNPHSEDIDELDTMGILRVINAEDGTVAAQVRRVLKPLAKAVDLAVERIERGGHVHYFGAGTSGRLALLDAVELVPTYGVPGDLFVAHQAGGVEALLRSVEDVEDDEEAGVRAARATAPEDLIVGITASGRTPYVSGVLREAARRGSATVLISANPAAPLAQDVDVHVAPDTGPEVIAGSTRMKAGTAQKLVLNAFSTATMIRLGRTWSNLMVSVVATNTKLRRRSVRILEEATGAAPEVCEAALHQARGDLKVALVSALAGTPARTAEEALETARGSVRAAVSRLRSPAAESGPGVVVAIDAGASGSRLRAVDLSDGSVTLETRVREGVRIVPARIDGGEEGGIDVETLGQALDDALASVRGSGVRVATVVVAAASSIALTGDTRALRSVAEHHGAERLVLASDALAAYLGALGDRPGAVVAAGTGVVALGRDGRGNWTRADGWGHLVGDEGSGAWIGAAALRAALRCQDGRPGGSQPLLDRLRERFGSSEELSSILYRRADRPSLLASFVPDVASAAQEGDEVARRIWRSAGKHLAEAAAAALPNGARRVSYTGGVFEAGGLLLEPFLEALHKLRPEADPVPPVGTGLDGAVALAALIEREGDVPRDLPFVRVLS